MDDLVQHEEHFHRDSIDVLDRFRGPLCLHGSLESEDNLCRNVAHAAPHRPYDYGHTHQRNLNFGDSTLVDGDSKVITKCKCNEL